MSSEPQWRCVVCNKPKDLRGPHLKGKTKVRSDCWPCAVKREFVLVNADEAIVAAPAKVVAASTPPQAANPFVKSATQEPKPAAVNPFGNSSPSTAPPSANPFQKSASSTQLHAGKPLLPNAFASSSTPSTTASSNPFAKPAAAQAPLSSSSNSAAALFKAPSAPAAAAVKSPFAGVFGAPSAANPFLNPQAPKPATAGAPALVMQSQSPSKPSPPFTFVAAKKLVAPALGLQSSQASAPRGFSSDDTWKCAKCGKAKDLRGEHLAGKTIVRSDCWPCAVKRVFIRHDPSGEAFESPSPTGQAAASSSVSPDGRKISSKTSPELQQQRTNSTPDSITSSFASCCVVPSNTPASPIVHASSAPGRSTPANVFVDPVVPSAVNEVYFFLSASSTTAIAAELSAFSERLFGQVRKVLVQHRADESNIHVSGTICTVFIPPSMATSIDAIGSLILAAERRIAASSTTPTKTRIFADSPTSLVASCMYKIVAGDAALSVAGPSSDASDFLPKVALLAQAKQQKPQQTDIASKEVFLRTQCVVAPQWCHGESLRLAEGKQPAGAVDIVLVSSHAPTRDDVLAVAALM